MNNFVLSVAWCVWLHYNWCVWHPLNSYDRVVALDVNWSVLHSTCILMNIFMYSVMELYKLIVIEWMCACCSCTKVTSVLLLLLVLSTAVQWVQLCGDRACLLMLMLMTVVLKLFVDTRCNIAQTTLLKILGHSSKTWTTSHLLGILLSQ